jgi:hypothetical protein
MSVIRRKNTREQEAAAQREAEAEALHQRALRLVDTRGVVLRDAEAELQAALAAQRAYSTPEREQRLAQAIRALEEAKKLS